MGLRSASSQHLPAQQQDTGRCQPWGDRGEHQACPNPALPLDSEHTAGPPRLGSHRARRSLTHAPDRQSLAPAQARQERGSAAPAATACASLSPGKTFNTGSSPQRLRGEGRARKAEGYFRAGCLAEIQLPARLCFPSKAQHREPSLSRVIHRKSQSMKSDICFPHQNHSASTEANGTQKQP